MVAPALIAAVLLGAAAPPVADPGHTQPPLFTGTALIVGGSAAWATQLGLHVVAYEMIMRTCIVAGQDLDDFNDRTAPDDANDVEQFTLMGIACLGIANEALRVRIAVPIVTVVGLGTTTGGALLRGRTDAQIDHLTGRRRPRRARALEIVGATVFTAGIATWLGSRAAMPTRRSGCSGIRCYMTYDIVTFQIAAALGFAGSTMWSYGGAYRRREQTLLELSIPRLVVVRGAATLVLSARF